MDAGETTAAREVLLGRRLAAIRAALSAADREKQQGPGDLPSTPAIRELLRLFAHLPSEDLRQAVLALLRTIVDVPCAR